MRRDLEDTAIVLAAGRSSRMGFNKLAAPLAGHPLVWYPVANLRQSGISRIIAVLGQDADSVRHAIGSDVECVVQHQQRGTGHAVSAALPSLALHRRSVIVLFGDCPFLDKSAIGAICDVHAETNAVGTVATALTRTPQARGRILRRNDNIERISDASVQIEETIGSVEIFVGLSVWKTDFLRASLERLPIKRRGLITEQDLPDLVEVAWAGGETISSFRDVGEDQARAPNTASEFEAAAVYLQRVLRSRLTERGVSIPDPSTVIIDYDVEVGPGTVLRSGTKLLGATKVGNACDVGPNAILHNCLIRDNSVVGPGNWEGQVLGAKV